MAPNQDVSKTSSENEAWHSLELNEVFSRLDASEQGLSESEADVRRERCGFNELPQRQSTSPWKRFLLQFHNPLIYVLLATAALTAFLQHWVDVGVIVGVVVVNAIIGFIQESKAESALESLKEMLAPEAIILRDGHKQSVPARRLVPGDVVLLQSGDKVPADLRLLKSKNLQIEEAALTGESVTAEKSAGTLPEESSLGDRTNMAFSSTLVTTGTAAGIVVATGQRTQIGQIADMLQDVQTVDTPLMRRLGQFSRVITVVILAFCVLIFIAGTLAGTDATKMLMMAVALAVSAIPEGLPAIMTIALAIGVKRMASRNAVIRKLPAVEALGSATVICTDKTGTLTRNEMTVTTICAADQMYRVEGVGYQPLGAIRIADDDRAATAAGDEPPPDSPLLRDLLRACALCNDSILHHEEQSWWIDGDPTEGALLVLAKKAGWDLQELSAHWQRTDEIPFESELQFMATLHHDHDGAAVISLKGSPERILEMCETVAGDDQAINVRSWQEQAEQLAGTGQRVLAIAQKPISAEKVVLGTEDLRKGCQLLGLVGMIDPPRDEAIEAIGQCKAAGIRVKMITGDHLATAKTIAGQIGIPNDKALSGSQVDQVDEADFDRIVQQTDVFARVSPSHKLRFVQSLQQQGEVVAMTGDGVNDAPALKQADIGVAMGINGTEVSKEAAEIVILDDNFASIEQAVEEGRTVYDNLKKTILFILPTNGGECLTLVAALLLGATMPILPLHILWINLVTTVALAITLAFDPVESDIMRRPPRASNEPLIDREMIWRIVYVSILMAIGTFGLFRYELQQGHSQEVARAAAVNVIVFFEIFYLINSRRLRRSVLNVSGLFGNRFALLGIAVVVVLQMAFTYWSAMQTMFEVDAIGWGGWLRILGCGVALLLIVEFEKAVLRRLVR